MIADTKPLSVLIVSGTEKGSEFVTSALPVSDFAPIVSARNAGEARRMLVQSSFDIIIVNTPLPDEFGTDFAIELSAETYAGILLLVKSELYEEVSYKAEACGVHTLAKPVSRQFFSQTIRQMTATRRRLEILERKTQTLKEKIDEIRIVNRAKWVLISTLGMDEEQAHRYIEKLAMDTRRVRRAVAEDIIRTYEERS